jgi:hypothetical protein
VDAMLCFDGEVDGVFFKDRESAGDDGDLGAFDIHFDEGGNFKFAASAKESVSTSRTFCLSGHCVKSARPAPRVPSMLNNALPVFSARAFFTGMTFSSLCSSMLRSR